jgi:hypothetical protein
VSGGRYEPVSEAEAAMLGRALLAKMRGEELTSEERALLSRSESTSALDERTALRPVEEVSETLLTLERGEGAELRVTWRRFRGSGPFLDIRRWEKHQGGLRPTRQGVTIRAREIGLLLTAVMAAANRVGED